MTREQQQTGLMYEHCDIPDGVSLAQWRAQQRRTRRRPQAGGVLAAIASVAPAVRSLRFTRAD